MSQEIAITALVENTVNVAGLRAEHGLAFLIRAGGKKLLFDTGQSDLLLHNARQMGLSLEGLDAVVLSHGHYDHTGGLEAVYAASPVTPVFFHPAALAPKFARNADGSSRSIGMREGGLNAIRRVESHAAVKPREIIEGLWLTGEIPRQTSFEDTGGRFYLDDVCTLPDALLDDQALYFDTSQGVVVVLGCCHSGVVNTLEHITALTHGRPFRTVIGGMHLMSASMNRMNHTLKAFEQLDKVKLYPAHCTGIAAITKLWAALPERCAPCPVGTTIRFGKGCLHG